jgi:hypothetical protein
MSHKNRQLNNNKTLEQDLKRLYQTPGHIPTAMDQTILNMAETQLTAQRPVRLYRVLSAAAAVLVVGISLVFLSPLLQPKPLLAEDLDQNGRVNILDALHLARQLPVDTQSHPQWDFNSDGSITQADIDHIAHSAVRLVSYHQKDNETTKHTKNTKTERFDSFGVFRVFRGKNPILCEVQTTINKHFRVLADL